MFNEVRFTLSAEGPVFPDLTPEIETFLEFPCPIYILVNKQILEVMMLLYRPDSTSPIYAYADNELWEVSVCQKQKKITEQYQEIHKDAKTKVSDNNEPTVHWYKYNKIFKSGFIKQLIRLIQNELHISPR